MDLEDKIRTLRVLKSTLHVWEVLAVNRYKKYSSVVGAQLPYFLRLQEVLEHLFALYSGLRSELLEMREEKSVDILLLTTDRGYVGDLVSKTVKALEDFLWEKRGKKVNLFIAGRRGASSGLLKMGAVVFEGVLTKDINWEVVTRINDLLVERYRRGFSDACYVIFQRPDVGVRESVELEERERKEAFIEESPFFYPRFEEVLRAKSLEIVERGRYSAQIIRFLPPDIRKRYSRELVLNIEAEEKSFVDELLKLYLSFFLREVFLEHFTSINFARYRTIRRINENIDRKLILYRRLINRLRQERITKEIEDIVFAYLATEEVKLRDYREEGYVLEVDVGTSEDIVCQLLSAMERFGMKVRSVERRKLLGGFRLVSDRDSIDLSVIGKLSSLKLKVAESIFKNLRAGSSAGRAADS